MLKDLEKKREEIVKEFKEFFLKRYPIRPPVEVEEFIEEFTKGVVDAVIDNDFKNVDSALDNMMRYLATDSRLSAGGSIATLFHLKDIIAGKVKLDRKGFEEISRRVDLIVCKAFDHYMNAREDLYKAKYRQMEFELKAQMRQFEFCMRHCPFLKRGFDAPPEGIERISSEDSEKHR